MRTWQKLCLSWLVTTYLLLIIIFQLSGQQEYNSEKIRTLLAEVKDNLTSDDEKKIVSLAQSGEKELATHEQSSSSNWTQVVQERLQRLRENCHGMGNSNHRAYYGEGRERYNIPAMYNFF